MVNLDEYKSVGIHWLALNVNGENVTYLDRFEVKYRFGVEYIPKETKKLVGNKNITTNIYKIPVNNSVMCECFCIGFIDFVLKGKSLLDYTNLFSPNEH